MSEGNVYSLSQLCTNEEKRDTLTNLKEGISSISTIFKNLEQNEHVTKKVNTLLATQAFVEQQLDDVTTNINIRNKLSNILHPQPILPKFGPESTLDVEGAREYCGTFGDKADETTFQEFWDKVTMLTEMLNLSEDCIKKLLGNLLQNEAYLIFFSNRSKPMKDILQLLVDHFVNPLDTFADHIQRLESLTRNPSESLESVMARSYPLISLTEIIVPESDRASRENHILRELLMKFCLPKAKKVLLYYILLSVRNNFTLDYKQCLEICIQAEEDEEPSVKLKTFTQPNLFSKL